MITVEDIQICLQLFDRDIIDEKKLSELIGLDFEKAEITKEWDVQKIDQTQLFLQMYDKQLISDEAVEKLVLKCLNL
jgi:hypothetical protein